MKNLDDKTQWRATRIANTLI